MAARRTVGELLELAKQLEASVERQRKENEDMSLAMAEILGRTPKKGKVRQRATERLEQLETPEELFVPEITPLAPGENIGRAVRRGFALTDEELYARQIMAEERAPREQTGAANSGGAADAVFNAAILPGYVPLDQEFDEIRFHQAEQRYATDIMLENQMDIVKRLKKMEQNNLFKEMQLKKNQNQVLNQTPYINQKQDIATSQRRAAEELKAQQDYFTRAENVSQIMHEQQYLTQQVYANQKWGIPAVQGLVYDKGDYFTSR